MKTLYEQGVNKVEIIVKKQTGGGVEKEGNKEVEAEQLSTQPKGGEEEATNQTWKTAVFGSENKQKIHRVIKTNATHTLAVGWQITLLGLNYRVGGIGYAMGDEAYQDYVQRQVEIATDVTGVAQSISMGALYGSWGGPVGALLGALTNGASTIMSTGYKYRGRQREYDAKLFRIENGIEYKKARASIDLTNGRLR